MKTFQKGGHLGELRTVFFCYSDIFGTTTFLKIMDIYGKFKDFFKVETFFGQEIGCSWGKCG